MISKPLHSTSSIHQRALLTLTVVVALCLGGSLHASPPDDDYYARARTYLESLLYTREAVERWLQGNIVYGEQYHNVLGWVHNPRTIQNGIDQSYTINEYDDDGARRVIAYHASRCRINTYGDSFTSCEQVNDGETWQEMLAAHLCEPVRNFGIGGYSVYQSYRRLLIEEPKTPAKYIIFNIFYDDHYRNLTGWRNIRLGITKEMRPDVSSPTLPYIKANPAKQEFVECDNVCPTGASVNNLCDADWVFKTFKDNFVLKLRVAERNIQAGQPEKSYAMISELAREHGLNLTINSAVSLKQAIDRIFTRAGIYASKRIVEKVEAYAKQHDKKVLYVLSYGDNIFKQTIQAGERFDREFVDYLNQKKLPYVDLLDCHLKDFAQYKIDADAYAKQYWIGHYSPRGNFFEAYAVKDKVVEMLDPKPAPYQANPAATFESPWEGSKRRKSSK